MTTDSGRTHASRLCDRTLNDRLSDFLSDDSKTRRRKARWMLPSAHTGFVSTRGECFSPIDDPGREGEFACEFSDELLRRTGRSGQRKDFVQNPIASENV